MKSTNSVNSVKLPAAAKPKIPENLIKGNIYCKLWVLQKCFQITVAIYSTTIITDAYMGLLFGVAMSLASFTYYVITQGEEGGFKMITRTVFFWGGIKSSKM